jgi:prolyl-tRNA synthetase
LPPKLAPVQVIIVPVRTEAEQLDYCQQLCDILHKADVRVEIDSRDDERFGYKLNKWEVKGVPIILKIGDNEVESSQVTAKRRDDGSEKMFSKDNLEVETVEILDNIQNSLLEKSKQSNIANTREAKNYDEFKDILIKHKGFVKVNWNDNPDIEAKIKAETKAVSRCKIASDQPSIDFYTGEPASDVWLFAQSY